LAGLIGTEIIVNIKAIALTLALATGVGATTASALPLAGSGGYSEAKDAVVLAAYKKKGFHKHRYTPGSRHKHAPKNWHRYDKRPGDWSKRGCVIVGPIWWCP
jgi:hypothetical protein